MMGIEKRAALLLEADSGAWQILFEPLAARLRRSLALCDIAEIRTTKPQKLESSLAELAKIGYTQVVVLYENRPFLAPEDILKSLQQHQESQNSITALHDAKGRAQSCGWYAAKPNFSRIGAYQAGNLRAINTRKELAAVNQEERMRVIEKHLKNGVNIPFLDGVVITPEVEIGVDTTILPGTILKGSTKIGIGCEIGPNSHLTDAKIGDRSVILSSYVDHSVVDQDVKIGPMSNIRPGSRIRSGVKIGDFVEIKNSDIGAETSVSHLTYLGDSEVGRHCNFGCGVVTVNYDGANKNRTKVGDGAFIGCNCNLIAPVALGQRVYAAAGTTITDDVPDDSMVIGRVRQTVKEGWVKEHPKFEKGIKNTLIATTEDAPKE